MKAAVAAQAARNIDGGRIARERARLGDALEATAATKEKLNAQVTFTALDL